MHGRLTPKPRILTEPAQDGLGSVYCINHRSSNVARARFAAEEVASLTLEFCKRNDIEDLFLSPGIIRERDGHADFIVVHLSSLLRAPGEQDRRKGFIAFVADVQAAKELARPARKAA